MASTPLNALNGFLAVARRLSYAAAAKDLGVSTSAISQLVQQLEARLQVPLLRRTSRSVALTDAGQLLLEQAGPAFDKVLNSLQAVKSKPGEITGQVRLTIPSAAIRSVMARLLPVFLARHPRVEVEIQVEDRLIDAVSAGFDAGIRLIESIDRDMIQVRLTPPTRLVVAGAPIYLEQKGVPVKPSDLLQHNCINIRWSAEKGPWAWELERRKKTWRVPVRGPVVTNDLELMRLLAIAGVGLWYGLESSVAQELARGELRVVLADYAPAVSGLYLYFPNRAQISSALKAFIDLVRSDDLRSGTAL